MTVVKKEKGWGTFWKDMGGSDGPKHFDARRDLEVLCNSKNGVLLGVIARQTVRLWLGAKDCEPMREDAPLAKMEPTY